jgi:hypothetical protein
MENQNIIPVQSLFDMVFINPTFKPIDAQYIRTRFVGLKSGRDSVFFLMPIGCDQDKLEFICVQTDPATNFITYRRAEDNTKYNSITISSFSLEDRVLEPMFYYIQHHIGNGSCSQVLIKETKDCGIQEKWLTMQKRLLGDKKYLH